MRRAARGARSDESLRIAAVRPHVAPEGATLEEALARIRPLAHEALGGMSPSLARGELAQRISRLADETLGGGLQSLDLLDRRDLVTQLLNELLTDGEVPVVPAVLEASPPVAVEPKLVSAAPAGTPRLVEVGVSATLEAAREIVQPVLVERIDVDAAVMMPRGELAGQIGEIVTEILAEKEMQLNRLEQRDLVTVLLNEMLGFGPLEPLLADDAITDILVNGHGHVYVERGGKLDLTDVRFRDDAHVMNIATRIVSQIGRRIDESSPLVDARLLDGSRVNIIVPPLAIDGPTISIRKFGSKGITLDVMMRQGNISEAMASILRIAARSKLNILISGGTGSGKTTMLNAMSQMIDADDRIVTIEDAAELQLQQPHVVRLETRPPNLEGHGEIGMRDLLRNTLRMRPDRIILGEVRGGEVVDMLQAMNTGHDGSLCTVHANNPREALIRLENMVGLAGVNLSPQAVRTQIAAAIDLIVQVSRMRDGIRRVTHIVEVVGMEEQVVTTQDLFSFEYEGENSDGRIRGRFAPSGLRPHFTPKAAYFNLDRALIDAMALGEDQ